MISIIVPAYERPLEVMQLLTSIYMTRQKHKDPSHSIEVIVADDASPTYNHLELIPPVFGPVLRAETNGGFAANCNLAASVSSSEILFFVNQDVVFPPDAVGRFAETINKHFEEKPHGIWAPMIISNGSINAVGGFFDGNRQPVHYGLGWKNPDSPRIKKQSVTWTTGAAFAIDKKTFTSLGGFSMDYPGGYFEDVDLCLKVRDVGLEIWADPSVRLIHSVGTTGGNPAGFFKNAATFKSRWYDSELTRPESSSVYVRYW